ncbi:MAG: hypothetical protein IT310_13345 [Anaerolineales bacterium]|nr:hypothetical protein [Anaerolineales bacterium]
MIKGFLGLPWLVWAGVALLIALVYSFFGIPKSAELAVGLRFFILRWGHALTWVLLAINFALRGAAPNLDGLANVIAAAGGVMYLLFMLTAFVVK